MTIDQKKQVEKLLKGYAEIFSDIPGQSRSVMHHIRVVTDCPFKVKPYIIPEHYRDKVEAEITELQRLKIIQRSSSNYSSPMVVIKKEDNPNMY